MTETPQTRTVESVQVGMLKRRSANISAALRRMADDIDRHASELDTPSQRVVAPYGRIASDILHVITWGFANLSTDSLAQDAAEADVYRVKGQ